MRDEGSRDFAGVLWMPRATMKKRGLVLTFRAAAIQSFTLTLEK
jgi:hypothetical protein